MSDEVHPWKTLKSAEVGPRVPRKSTGELSGLMNDNETIKEIRDSFLAEHEWQFPTHFVSCVNYEALEHNSYAFVSIKYFASMQNHQAVER